MLRFSDRPSMPALCVASVFGMPALVFKFSPGTLAGGETLKTLKMVVPPPFSVFSKLRLPVPANWPGDETLKPLKMVVPPSFSKFSKFSPGTLAGGGTLL